MGFQAATKVSEKISRAARVLYATKQNPRTFWRWSNFDGFTPCIQKICLSLLSLDEENLQLSVKTIFFKLDSLVIPRCFWLLPLMKLPIVDIATWDLLQLSIANHITISMEFMQLCDHVP